MWQQVLSLIKKKISKPSFDTWLKSTSAAVFTDSVLVVCAPNKLAKDWLENRYVQLISACEELTGHDVEIKFIIKDEEETENETLPQPQPKPKPSVTVNEESGFTIC